MKHYFTPSSISRLPLLALPMVVFLLAIAYLPQAHNPYEVPKALILHFYALLILAATMVGLRPFNFSKLTRFSWLVTILGLLWMVSTIFSSDPFTSLWGTYDRRSGLLTWLSFFVIAVYISRQEPSEKLLNRLGWAYGLSGLLVSGYGLMQFCGLVGDYAQRPNATFAYVNVFAGFLAVSIPLTLALYLRARPKIAGLVLLPMFLVQSVALLSTYCRGAWGAVLLSCGLILILSWIKSPKRKRNIPITLLAVSVLISILIFQHFIVPYSGRQFQDPDLNTMSAQSLGDRFTSALNPATSTMSSRKNLWKIATQVALQHPFLGAGPETFAIYYQQLRPPEEVYFSHSMGIAEHAHNEFFHLACNIGLPALLIYLIILCLAFTRLFKLFRRDLFNFNRWLLLCLGITLAANLLRVQVNVNSLSGNLMIWIALGFLHQRETDDSTETISDPKSGRMAGYIGLIALLCLGGWILAGDLNTLRASLKINQGSRAVARNQLELADQIYAEVEQLTPREGLLSRLVAEYYFGKLKQEDGFDLYYPRMAKIFHQLTAIHSNDPRYVYYEGRYLWKSYQFRHDETLRQEAIRLLTQAASMNPYNLDVAALRMEAEQFGENWSAMVLISDEILAWLDFELYSDRVAQGGNDSAAIVDIKLLAAIYRMRGRALFELNRIEEALEVYRLAAKGFPFDRETHYQLGVLAIKQNNFTEAKRELVKCLRIEPEHIAARWNLALILYDQGKVRDALLHLNLLLGYHPDLEKGWELRQGITQGTLETLGIYELDEGQEKNFLE